MQAQISRLVGILAALICIDGSGAGADQYRSRGKPTPPTIISEQVADPYRWMEDLNSPELKH
jgi:hypothetical protein